MGGGDSDIKETEEQKASAQVAMQRWNDYQTLFKPYEQKYFDKVERLNSDASMAQVTGLADRAVTSSFNNSINSTARGMAANGINPNSGLFQKEINKLEQQKAKSRADSTSKAQVAQQNRFVSGLQSIAQMGQGQSVDAISGLGDVAQNANSYAHNAASMSVQNSIGNNQVVGAVIGGGLNYYLEGQG